MKKTGIVLFFVLASNAHAWDTTFKADVQHASTDNVNLTNTAPISDTYNTFGGYLQTKNDEFRFKLKGKTEKYSKEKENNDYAFDLSVQYKHSKSDDYTISVFKQVYDGTPVATTDTTSDNSGGKFEANFNLEYDKEANIYFNLNGTYKNYPKLAGRKDRIIGGTAGLEKYITPAVLFNPEFNIQSDGSTNSYYSNFSFGPSALLSFTLGDKWELFFDVSYARSNYSDRMVTTTVKGKTVSDREYQDLLNLDVGLTYSIVKSVQLQAKYSRGKNTSNDSSSAYKANVLSFGLSFKL